MLGLLLAELPSAGEPPAPLTDAKLKVWVDNLVARRLETKKSLNFSILVYGFYHHKFQAALDGWMTSKQSSSLIRRNAPFSGKPCFSARLCRSN